MRICLLTDQDLDADVFPADDFRCDPRPFLPDADWQLAHVVDDKSSVKAVEALIEEGFDLFFNLCGGSASDDYPGIEVVRTLEKHGAIFTGPTSAFYDPTRQQMKRACRRAEIATPAYAVIRREEDADDEPS
jgi:hypothetical protein